ncbi:MAG: molybdenum cofactor biosynthesis protein MoaE [Acidiferrobacterales bacterium]
MEIRVFDGVLDPLAEVSEYEQSKSELAGHFGATSIFVGTMRDRNQGGAVSAMTLEHYPGMTEKYLTRVSEEAAKRWDIMDSLVVHRVGAMLPNDPIVVVAVWSAHRDDAFKACRYIIDELKTRAPFWKKEMVDGGERWVSQDSG